VAARLTPSRGGFGAAGKFCHIHQVELYDLARDPWGQNDLCRKTEAAPVLADFLARLHKHLVETADSILQGAVTSPHYRQAPALLEQRGA